MYYFIMDCVLIESTGIEEHCIVLRRLQHLFGRSKVELSYIFNEVLDCIYTLHGHLLTALNTPWLSHQNLDRFAAAVNERGGPLENCWGFIDGTVRRICRPQQNQTLVFNGHKRVHGIKFQSIVAPNGIVVHLYAPIEGRRHDAGMLRESDVEAQMEHHITNPNGEVYSMYGDPAYPLSPFIISPYRGGVISANQMRFNKKMSVIRSCIGWTFGKIISLFAYLDNKKNQKLYLQSVGKYYKVAVLFTNCHNCLYGSETSSFFGLDPPSLHDYLQG